MKPNLTKAILSLSIVLMPVFAKGQEFDINKQKLNKFAHAFANPYWFKVQRDLISKDDDHKGWSPRRMVSADLCRRCREPESKIT